MKRAAKAGQGRSWLWLQGAGAGGIVAVAPGTALVLAVLLCPAIVYFMTETVRGRPVARTMLLFGATATFMPLRRLWEQGTSLSGALAILSDPGRPLLAWFACGVGWMLCEATQIVFLFALAASARHQIQLLKREQAELTAEWTLP